MWSQDTLRKFKQETGASAGLSMFPIRLQEKSLLGGILEIQLTLAENVSSSGKMRVGMAGGEYTNAQLRDSG